MSSESDNAESQPSRCWIEKPWLRRMGACAFLFFLIKGLAWLVVPAVLAWTVMK